MFRYNEKLNRISFETKNIDLSILNGIRRVLLMDIPILGFIGNGSDTTVNIIENNTVLNNEIIQNRIALIPLHISETYNDEFDESVNSFKISLDVKCESNENIKEITTNNLKVLKDDKEIKNCFPTPITITKLRKNEILKLEASAVKETGRKNTSFNIVAGASVFNKPEKEFDTKTSILEQERNYIKNEYILEFELINSFSFKYILLKAVDVLINKIMVVCDKLKIEEFENNDQTYDINIPEENDTIGNIIQTYIYNNYVNRKNIIIEDIKCTYVGYIVKHPLDNVLTVRITLDKKVDNYNVLVMNIFNKICNEIKENELHKIKTLIEANCKY
jgi:DNA-directed RNA polymerase alpha subunit